MKRTIMNNRRLLNAFLITVSAMCGTALGLAADPITVGANHTVSGDWLVDIRTICAVGGVVLPATAVLAAYATRINLRLREGDERFERLEKSMQGIQVTLKAMPCTISAACDLLRHKR